MTEDTILSEAESILDPADRSTYLDRVCGDDLDLRSRIEEQLRSTSTDDPSRSVKTKISSLEAETQGVTFQLPPIAAGGPEITSTFEPSDATTGETDRDRQTSTPFGRPTNYRPLVETSGTRIGPYRLVRKLGEGGMGAVYLAEQEYPVRRNVALKIIKPGMDSEQVVARFEAERQTLAIMDHPNIARVYDAGVTESGRPFFVMELVEGIPITEFCDRNR